MKLDRDEIETLEGILTKLEASEELRPEPIVICPFPGRPCEHSCGRIFPETMYGDTGTVCPCFAIIDKQLTLEKTIRKVREAIENEEI